MMRGVWCSWVAFSLVVVLAGCRKQEEKPFPAPPPPAVTKAGDSAKLSVPHMPVLPEMVATIQGGDVIPVKAPQTGYLVRQVYKDDAIVAAGDVLFLLDPRTSHEGATSDGSTLVRIVSPSAGVPGPARHGAGDWVEKGMEVTGLAEIDTVAAELSLPESLARQIQVDLDLSARDPAQPEKEFELVLPDGSIYAERGYAETMPSSGTIHVLLIYFPNPDHVLRPGEFVKVRSLKP